MQLRKLLNISIGLLILGFSIPKTHNSKFLAIVVLIELIIPMTTKMRLGTVVPN